MSKFKRIFRPIGEGSSRGAVFTLFSGSVGAGVLSLPKVMSYYGFATGIFMIVLNAYLAYTSYMALFKAITLSGRKRYPNLVNFYLGKTPAKLFAYSIICVQFLAVCIFICIGWNFIQHMIMDYKLIDLPTVRDPISGNLVVDNYSKQALIWRAIILYGLMTLMLPLSLMKDISSLRYFSLGNLIVLVYLICVTIGQAPSYYFKNEENPNYEFDIFSHNPTMNWISGFSTILLSYMCHPNFFYVRSDLVDPSFMRVKKVIKNAIVLETAVYLCMASAGYLSLGQNMMVDLFALRPGLSKLS